MLRYYLKNYVMFFNMIDEKKIDKACKKACDRALKNSGFNNNVHAYPYVRGFYDCAKWAFNEFRKDLWHPASEEPVENKPFLAQEIGRWRVGVNSPLIPNNEWSTYCKIQGIKRWLYVEDLLPKTQKGDKL